MILEMAVGWAAWTAAPVVARTLGQVLGAIGLAAKFIADGKAEMASRGIDMTAGHHAGFVNNSLIILETEDMMEFIRAFNARLARSKGLVSKEVDEGCLPSAERLQQLLERGLKNAETPMKALFGPVEELKGKVNEFVLQ